MDFLQPLSTSDGWVSLLMLTFMEVVLGIDNIIFISIITNKLPAADEKRARNIGLFLAMLFRVVLLFGISYIVGMQQEIISFNLFGKHVGFTGQAIILILGGLFLLYKSTNEIYHKLEGGDMGEEDKKVEKGKAALTQVIFQICLLNIVFSFDSILTAIGLTKSILIMIISVILSMIIMMAFSGPVARFINKHPSMQMLGLSFLILIGFMLIAEGAHKAHLIGSPDQAEVIPKGYLYFAIFFSVGVEVLNMQLRKREKPVKLHSPASTAEEEGLLGNL